MAYNTQKRNLIIEFFKNNSQFSYTVDELCERVFPDGNAKSTAYRIVGALTREGILKSALLTEQKRIAYQYAGDGECKSHLHLKCRDCGTLICLDCEMSHALESELLLKEGFSLDGGAMIYGKCNACRKGD